MKQKVILQCTRHWIHCLSIYLSFMEYLGNLNTNNTTGVTYGAATAYPSGKLGFTSGVHVAQALVFCAVLVKQEQSDSPSILKTQVEIDSAYNNFSHRKHNTCETLS